MFFLCTCILFISKEKTFRSVPLSKHVYSYHLLYSPFMQELLVTKEQSNLNRLTHPNSFILSYIALWSTFQKPVCAKSLKKKLIEASKRLSEQQGGLLNWASHWTEMSSWPWNATESCSPLLSPGRLQWQSVQRVSLKLGSLFTDEVETYIKSTVRI